MTIDLRALVRAELEEDAFGMFHIRVHHDHWCLWLARMEVTDHDR
jgi:hypothetical protein